VIALCGTKVSKRPAVEKAVRPLLSVMVNEYVGLVSTSPV